MAKKRKAHKSFEQPSNTKSAKYDIEQNFDDSEDEFYAGRDKILLDESADTKRRRKLVEQEKDLQPSDEEVLAYQDDEESEEGTSDDHGGSDYDDEQHGVGGKVRPERARRSEHGEEEDEESEEEYWGTNREDYYGDDVIETEEQAREEENEAKRLQQKQLKNMSVADFGFDENEWVEAEKDTNNRRSVTEKLPDAQIPEGASNEQKLDILKNRYPEFVPLAEEFTSLQHTKRELDATASRILKSLDQGAQMGEGLPVTVKRDALSAYLATISMYFAVISSSISKETNSRKITAMPPLQLHEHAVIPGLARARELWESVADEEIAEPLNLPKPTRTPAVEVNGVVPEGSSVPKTKSRSKSPLNKKAKEKLKTPRDQSGPVASGKKTTKAGDKGKTKPLELSDLINGAEDESEDSEFGDEQPLTQAEYAEKANKRKSLRFYTSQIASKANKRGRASRVAGGDDDLPYKERQKDRQERLLKQAETRGRAEPDEADDFGDDDYEDLPARDANNDYYDILVSAKSKKQADKQARTKAYRKAAAEGATVYEEESIDPNGKRAITYAIAKNKGLQPKRNKDVRNPRVKKRKKFDEKMKKLGSVRQVYKGGQPRGGYGGELTGIKTNVVKSVKL